MPPVNDELLDLVDEKDRIIGEVWKSKAHKTPKLIHREVAVAVFNKNGEVLLQQRSLKKKIHPGFWTITTAGHVEKGENPKKTARREIFEEVGIKIKPVYFDKVQVTRAKTESRFFWIYYAILNKKPKTKIAKKEVQKVKWVKIKELDGFLKKQKHPWSTTSHKMITKIAKHLKFI